MTHTLAACETACVTSGPLEFVGRVTELSALREAIASARGGRGSTWLLCGEPGIGKSRLVEELALEADAAGFLSLWGRCWEAGGAPAFWPWIQIVRELVRHAEDTVLAGARLSYVVQLIPELRDRYPDVAAPPSASDHAQFALLDAVTSALCAVSRTQPLFVALEDLHVATPSSLLLLELVSQHVRGAPIVVVGTYRHIDVPGETGQLLHRIAQAGRTLAMAPLGRDEIAMVLGQATGRRPDPTLVDLVTERTEGNPLFLVELCRLMVARGASADVPQELVPATLRTAILRRLAGLRAPVRALLELAATVGRELSPSRLTGAFALRAEDVRAGLAEAERLAIVAPTADGGFRFTHILIREVLYQELSVARRQELHLQVGRWLETYGTGDAAPPWSEIAHHYAAAGDAARDAAIDAMERAAQGACATLAYAEAISSYRRAVEAVDTTPGRDGRRRVDLMIGLAHAQLHGGDLEAGRDTCLAAAALARERGAPDLLARAALELGSVLRFASVDPVLVALLGEALAMLRPEDARLRARVLARLASAKQPSDRPGEGVELALEAVELARTTEHPPTLLAALDRKSVV